MEKQAMVDTHGDTPTADLAKSLFSSEGMLKGEMSIGAMVRIDAYNGWYGSDLCLQMKAWSED